MFAQSLNTILHHKDLENGKYVKIIGWRDKEFAKEIISEEIERRSKHNHLSLHQYPNEKILLIAIKNSCFIQFGSDIIKKVFHL